MADVPEQFPAFVAERHDGDVRRGTRGWAASDLPAGEVTIAVEYSGINFKDVLATIPGGRVARISPLIPGIDLAGTVVADSSRRFAAGDRVLAHGYALGVSHHGGFAAYARVPGGWVVPLGSLTTREAMTIGTAGFTAAMSLERLQSHGLRPGDGPVLVTGASGGVGSMAVDLLAGQGYEVVASTGTAAAHAWLRDLGASEIIGRLDTGSDKPLEPQRWAGAVDCVGGAPLAAILRTLRHGGAVAASGNTAGMRLETTVAPFILRGVALLGIDSVNMPIERRRALWDRLGGDLRPRRLEPTAEITLAELDEGLTAMLRGRTHGRTIVALKD